MMNTLIVTRHAGVVEWLRRRGITGDVLEQAAAEDVTGKHVIGALPLHLAALADRVSSIDLPGLTRQQRGADLTADEMDVASATLRTYRVREI